MNICKHHQDELAKALKDRGLSAHASETPAEAIAREAAGGFDPYLAAYLKICNTCALAFGDPGVGVCAACTIAEDCSCGEPSCGSKRIVQLAADEALRQFAYHHKHERN